MTSAAESFALTLARASRQANRFLRSRQLDRASRDDVIAAAMLWCWENRDNYSLTATLEIWFLGAVRNAYRDYLRGEARDGATEIVQDMGAPDDTSVRAQALQAVEKIQQRVATMPEVQQKIAALILKQWTHNEIREELNVANAQIPEVRRKLAPLMRLIPDTPDTRWIIRSAVTPAAISSDDASDQLSSIDREIEALEFAPPQGKDCPPCWLCKWYQGFLPGDRKSVRMEISEAEVRDAVRDTEAEKIRIAQEVRDGNI
jgi:DNA-directed RNA polymerase specialized sigma24 family protein